MSIYFLFGATVIDQKTNKQSLRSHNKGKKGSNQIIELLKIKKLQHNQKSKQDKFWIVSGSVLPTSLL